ncbi:unnamed protein product [Lactuca virosa]|uniref:Retrotransposon gag domain-containing protein n=1 Tax=Lactuca virosa TaxID=75947 RepID=A0AAU9NQH0_9ASTR|nr:unnamed protein product [Lactuca virosa]
MEAEKAKWRKIYYSTLKEKMKEVHEEEEYVSSKLSESESESESTPQLPPPPQLLPPPSQSHPCPPPPMMVLPLYPPTSPPLYPLSLGFKKRNEATSLIMASPNQSGRKSEMPMFDGNTESWIMEAEVYFLFHKSLEDDKLEEAVGSLEGEALCWYECEHRRQRIPGWEELKGLIHRPCVPSMVGTLYKKLSAFVRIRMLKEQTTSLKDLTARFYLGQLRIGLNFFTCATIRELGLSKIDQTMDSFSPMGNPSKTGQKVMESATTLKVK